MFLVFFSFFFFYYITTTNNNNNINNIMKFQFLFGSLSPFQFQFQFRIGYIHGVFKTLAVLVLLLFPVKSTQQNFAAASEEDERSALVEFKDGIWSDPLGLLSSWNPSPPGHQHHCSWFGVSCDSQFRVVSINITSSSWPRTPGGNNNNNSFYSFACSGLYPFLFTDLPHRPRSCSVPASNKLAGKLSASLAKLSYLRVLSLPFNAFDGEIAPEIWGSDNLQVLDLEGNLISGTLPSQFTGLRKLQLLNLGFNRVSGQIPSSLSNCTSLEILNLAGNRLNGSIPTFLGKFGRLRALYLSLNQLSGSIPDEIGHGCLNLEHLDLSGNFLVGGIPLSLGNCVNLRTLQLFSNILYDVIPFELGQLRKLQVLDLSRNSLSGPVVPELGRCVELEVLVLSSLYDPILPGQENARPVGSSVEVLNATYDDFNYFQGGIPVNITNLPKLKILWAPRATLEGNIPLDWGACSSLEMVNLGHNLFTGEIPSAFAHCKNLRFLDLASNKLTGGLNVKLPLPCMTVFDVSANSLSGSIPRFTYEGCPPMNALPFQSEDPSSFYSSYFMQKAQSVISLPTFESSVVSVFHNFGGNSFSGPTPPLPIVAEMLGKQTVYAFLVDNNNLNGPFPGYLFDKCYGLVGFIANISSNKISGVIPMDISETCRSLKVFDISGNRLTGSIPKNLGHMDSLVSLDISRNQLSGQIPDSLSQLKGLKYLSLAGNSLTGTIPPGFGQLPSLEVLDLSLNSLSGEIPKDLVKLKNLTVLLLSNNNLSGQIPPGLANVTCLSSFNVSYNNLSGSLPLNANSMKCNSALGNPFLRNCHIVSLSVSPPYLHGKSGVPLQYAASPSAGVANKSSSGGFNSIEIASVTSASAIVSVLLALVILFLYTRKCIPRTAVHGARYREVILFTEIGVPLTFEIVMRATGNFNTSNRIGIGGFGETYKAEVSPSVLVAIKRLSVGRFQGVQQFQAEIKTLGRMRHPNLVTLIGFHASETEMFLIYNYLPGGNLENFIQERSSRSVDWRMLHKIALDIARALAYLHDQCVPRVLHRDVKPSNILLDNEFNAYLSDFGLARLLGTSETHATTGVAGTFGYVAPEYALTCRVSDKADVYSYGVVLLELISDKKALDPSFSSYGNGFNIVAWACMLLRQGRARDVFTTGLWDVGPHDDLVEILHLAVMCTVETLSVRPTMKQVVQRLKQLQPPTC